MQEFNFGATTFYQYEERSSSATSVLQNVATTTYTITTYTKGSTYNAGSTTYSIATTTKGRNSGTSYTVTTYTQDVTTG